MRYVLVSQPAQPASQSTLLITLYLLTLFPVGFGGVHRDLWASKGEQATYFRDALHKALLFFRAQRSGNLSGTENPIPYRTSPSFERDGIDVGVDLSRGYFDAGDYVKYTQPMALSMTMLAWSGIEFAQGFRVTEQLEELRSAVRWGADFFSQLRGRSG